MEALKTPFLPALPLRNRQKPFSPCSSKPPKSPKTPIIRCCLRSDPWTLSDGNKPITRHYKLNKKPLSDDDACRIIKGKARYLSVLRRNQGSHVQTPKWIRRTPEQMEQFLKDDRNGQLYGRHVMAAIRRVRSLSMRAEGSYDMREEMSSFVTKLTFKEMCIVLKEQKGWRQARDFFAWMKLQLCYRSCVMVYTIVLRIYGQVGKIRLAEQIFLEMLQSGCEPDEVACGTMLCTYARWGRHKEMMTFYSAVKARGTIPPVSVFNFMISSLQKKKLHKNVIQFWKEVIDAGVEPNHFTYTISITSYAKEGLAQEAFEIFNKMKKSGHVPGELTYSVLILLVAKNDNLDEALKLYEDMKSHRIVPSNYACASLLNLYYKHGDYSKALSLFSDMEKKRIPADEVIYSILVRIYGKLGLYEDAVKTFEEIEQLGLLSEEKTYVTMAQVHLNAGFHEKALNVLEIMKSRNIEFSSFAHCALLRCYALKEDVRYAEIAFQTLSKTCTPDAASCNDMLNLYMRTGLLEKAKAFIVRMRKDRIQFDEELYRTVMKVYCKEGMICDAEALLAEMESIGLAGDKFIQTSLMAIYRKCGKLEQAEEIFKTMEQPDAVALGQMLNLYLLNGDLPNASNILNLLLENADGISAVSRLISKLIREGKGTFNGAFIILTDLSLPLMLTGDISEAKTLYDHVINLGCQPEDAAVAFLVSFYGSRQQLNQAQEVFTAALDFPSVGKLVYRSMTEAYAKCGKFNEANHLYEEMLKRGYGHDAITISIVVNALTNHGKYQEAENSILKSFEDGVELDTVAYNTYIKAMLEAGKLDFASSIYDRMISLGIAASIRTYSSMISSVYGRSGKLDKAINMFDMACSSGVIDEKAYTNMILYYGKAGRSEEASHLFRKLQEEGIRPGKISYNTMINVYANVGHHLEAENIFQAMLNDGHAPDSFTYLALIRAYSKSQNYIEAEDIVDTMLKEGIRPLCAHFGDLLSTLTNMGLMDDAERVYTKIMKAGLLPDLQCCRAMLRGYMYYGHVDKGISFFEQMNGSVKPDGFVLSAAVHLYEHAGKELEAGIVLDSMNRDGIRFLKNLMVGSRLKKLSDVFPHQTLDLA
ncbi:hypothetical protein ACLOJK_033732 [Asimina triloba]